MFCPKCGTAMSDDANLCPACGTAAPASAIAAPPAFPSNVPGALPVMAPQIALAPQTEDKAVISLVLGILSLVAFSIFAGIPAIVLGKMSRDNIRASGGRLAGDGMALAGIIMGWVSVGFVVLFVLVIVIIIAVAGSIH